jgi:hypothetical protein
MYTSADAIRLARPCPLISTVIGLPFLTSDKRSFRHLSGRCALHQKTELLACAIRGGQFERADHERPGRRTLIRCGKIHLHVSIVDVNR